MYPGLTELQRKEDPLNAPPECELDGLRNADEYEYERNERLEARKEREKQEDENYLKNDAKAHAPLRAKSRRFKLYMKYEGGKGPAMFLRLRLPKHGGYEDGPSLAIKRLFLSEYNKLKVILSEHSCHLRSVESMLEIPDEDGVSAYIGEGGLILVCNSGSPAKRPENQTYVFGGDVFGKKICEKPELVFALQRKRVTRISCGRQHTACVTEGGRVLTWGDNEFGQCGNGREEFVPTPEYASIDYNVVASEICCGADFTLFLTKKKELYSFGRYQASNFPRLFVDTYMNGYECRGELGLKGLKLIKLACGIQHALVLTSEGHIYSFGYNDYGQLGYGCFGKDQCGLQKPRKIPITDEKNEDVLVSDIAAGGYHSVALTKKGELYAWGNNSSAQLGVGGSECLGIPTPVPGTESTSQVFCGEASTVRLTEKTAYIWGSVQNVATKTVSMIDSGRRLGDEMVGGCLGSAHGILIKEKDTIECYGFGYNSQNQALGRSSTEAYVSLEKIEELPEIPKHHPKIALSGNQSYVLINPNL